MDRPDTPADGGPVASAARRSARRQPGMHDVAARAGVSHQTVSRVLNGDPTVRPATRETVLEAVRALGYRRNRAARALVTRRTATVGVLAPGSALFGPTSTLVAVEGAAREAGYFVSVATVPGWAPEGIGRALEHFMEHGVEALVVIAPHDDAVAALGRVGVEVPVVVVGPASPGGGLHAVSVDQHRGARLATRHLLDLGHAGVAHVAGPADWIDARERLRGWTDELAADARAVPAPVLGDWTARSGYEAGRALLAGDLPTAVFAANDQLALGLLRAFAEAGVRVPEDVSVVGFDDVDGSAYFHPPLTTVRQDFDALGRRCLALVVALLEGAAPADELLEPHLVVRGSTAPPR